jgi:hypothetical protein
MCMRTKSSRRMNETESCKGGDRIPRILEDPRSRQQPMAGRNSVSGNINDDEREREMTHV